MRHVHYTCDECSEVLPEATPHEALARVVTIGDYTYELCAGCYGNVMKALPALAQKVAARDELG